MHTIHMYVYLYYFSYACKWVCQVVYRYLGCLFGTQGVVDAQLPRTKHNNIRKTCCCRKVAKRAEVLWHCRRLLPAQNVCFLLCQYFGMRCALLKLYMYICILVQPYHIFMYLPQGRNQIIKATRLIKKLETKRFQVKREVITVFPKCQILNISMFRKNFVGKIVNSVILMVITIHTMFMIYHFGFEVPWWNSM